MKTNGKTIRIDTTIFCLMVVFSLLFLPWMLGKIPMTDEEVEEKQEQQIEDPIISVYRGAEDRVVSVRLEEYVKGVVAGEMPATFEKEALKAQAVAARTYGMSKVGRWEQGKSSREHPDAPLCDTTHCQVYRTPEELERLKSRKWMGNQWKKVVAAVDETRGQVLYYQNTLVEQPLFHSSSGGKTEDSEAVFSSAVPYLRSVSSPYENGATHQNEETTLTFDALAKKLSATYPNQKTGNLSAAHLKVGNRSGGGRVESMKVGNSTFTGGQIRQALGLSSANFQAKVGKGTVTFVTVGYGHGVGMSQYGANGMAQQGADYREILAHYYSGVTVGVLTGGKSCDIL